VEGIRDVGFALLGRNARLFGHGLLGLGHPVLRLALRPEILRKAFGKFQADGWPGTATGTCCAAARPLKAVPPPLKKNVAYQPECSDGNSQTPRPVKKAATGASA
jgi:hypothetical protein